MYNEVQRTNPTDLDRMWLRVGGSIPRQWLRHQHLESRWGRFQSLAPGDTIQSNRWGMHTSRDWLGLKRPQVASNECSRGEIRSVQLGTAVNVSKKFYLPDYQNSVLSPSAYIEYRSKLCSNQLA